MGRQKIKQKENSKIEEKKESKIERIIKVGMFIIAILGAITAFINWMNSLSPKPNDELKNARLATYENLSSIVGRMISTSNFDTLKKLADTFYEKFYNGNMILVEDTTVSLAMRRFKFELEDKLNGVEDILDPQKFQKSGRNVIQSCQGHIKRGTENY